MPNRNIRIHRRPTILLACSLLVAACGPAGHQSGAPHPHAHASQPESSVPEAADTQHSFHSAQYGFTLHYPPDLRMTRGFERSYLANGRWKAYAGPGSTGSPVVALALPDSNHVTAAELRIGASRDPAAVKTCTQAPDTARGASGTRTLDGVPFTYFEAADAAMSHYLQTHSYRAVHDGTCIAIDLLVTGTRPEVYDPPATPPFTHAQAFERLRKALQGFRFDR